MTVKGRHKYYRFRNVKKYIPEKEIEESFVVFLSRAVFRPEVIKNIKGEIKRLLTTDHAERKKNRSELQTQADKLDKRLETLEKKWLDELVSDSKYEELRKKISSQKNEILKQIPNREGIHEEETLMDLRKLAKLIGSLSESYKNIPYSRKRDFIKKLLPNCTVTNENVYFKPRKEAEEVFEFAEILNGSGGRIRTFE